MNALIIVFFPNGRSLKTTKPIFDRTVFLAAFLSAAPAQDLHRSKSTDPILAQQSFYHDLYWIGVVWSFGSRCRSCTGTGTLSRIGLVNKNIIKIYLYVRNK
jgi:hypothetical protein